MMLFFRLNYYLIILFIIFQSNLFAQPKLSSKKPILYMPQGYVLESLNGYGYSNSVIASGLNIGNSNPSLLGLVDGIIISGSHHFESKIKDSWVADINHEREINLIPQSVGIHFPHKNLHWGFSFNQKYVSKLDYGKIIGTMLWDNDQGYIETGIFNIFSETKTYNYSTSIAYQVYQSIDKKHSLGIGFQLDLYNLKFEQKTTNIITDTLYQYPENYSKSIWDMGFIIGLTYKYQQFMIGTVFEKGTNFKKKVDLESADIYIEGSIPSRISFGIKFQISSTLDINGNISHVLWRIDRSVENQPEFNSSLIYKLMPNLTTSFGILYTDYRSEYDDSPINDKLRAIYLSTGLVYSYKNLDIHLAFADSHLFSQAWRKQTIIKAGIVVNL